MKIAYIAAITSCSLLFALFSLAHADMKIRNKHWGKCLNLQNHANKNGGLPNVWDCVTHDDQEWEIIPVGNGMVKIRNKHWGKCLNLQDHANKNGGLPNVWDCVTHDDQEWMIESS